MIIIRSFLAHPMVDILEKFCAFPRSHPLSVVDTFYSPLLTSNEWESEDYNEDRSGQCRSLLRRRVMSLRRLEPNSECRFAASPVFARLPLSFPRSSFPMRFLASAAFPFASRGGHTALEGDARLIWDPSRNSSGIWTFGVKATKKHKIQNILLGDLLLRS